MNIVKFNIPTVPDTDSIGERGVHPDYTEQIEIGKQQIAAILQLYLLAIGAFTGFFFQLKRIDTPVGDILETDFIAYMMLGYLFEILFQQVE